MITCTFPGVFSPGISRIASGTTARRYRTACIRAERYAKLMRLAHWFARLIFFISQALYPVRQWIAGVAYVAAGPGLWLRDHLLRRGMTYTQAEEGPAPTRPADRRKRQVHLNTVLVFCLAGFLLFCVHQRHQGRAIQPTGKPRAYRRAVW